MNDIILSSIPVSQMEQIIRDAVKEATTASTKDPELEPDRLNVDQACQLLNRTRSWIFKKTMNREIPFSKFGSRLVFSRKALLEWMESKTIPAADRREIMADRLTAAAKQKDR